MTINFDYHGTTDHLTANEVASLVKELDEVLPRKYRYGSYEFLHVDLKTLDLSGWYDDQDGDCDDHRDIERTLDKYDVDWDGGAEPDDSEPDWDKMPGGYDALYN